jgi:hypothetical protein
MPNETTEIENRAEVGGRVDPLVSGGRWSSAYNAANLHVCACYGAISHIDAAEKRLRSTQRAPLWLLKHLDEARRRMNSTILPELIRKRDELYYR